jgi:predicted ArsR family transcriptional regulator
MKTIKQIADELGVSKQAVAKRVATLPLSEVTVGGNGTKYISEVGANLIREKIRPRRHRQKIVDVQERLVEVGGGGNNLALSGDNLLAVIQEQLRAKDRQIEAKDRQIETLANALAEVQKRKGPLSWIWKRKERDDDEQREDVTADCE